MKETPFTAELRVNIRKYIRSVKRGGTVGMSVQNLKQCVPTPKSLKGAPMGGNIEWQYAELFREIALTEAKGFLIS